MTLNFKYQGFLQNREIFRENFSSNFDIFREIVAFF